MARETTAKYLTEMSKNTEEDVVSALSKDQSQISHGVTGVTSTSSGSLKNDPKAESKSTRKKREKKSSPIPDHIQVIKTSPGESKPTYHCTLCGKKFKTKGHIKYHAYCENKNSNKPFKCEKCQKGFISRTHYEYHQRVHTGDKPFKCPQCGQRFPQRGKLTRHEKEVHSKEKAFACDQCPKTFANKQRLNVHTRIHTGEKPFACTYCDKRFTGLTHLKNHVTCHTGERPFICDKCGKAFGLKWTLDLHLRTHSDERPRPFACDQCPKAFSSEKDLRRHCLTHLNAWPWICFLCDNKQRYGRVDNLSRHIRNVHGKERHEEAMKLAKAAATQYLKDYTGNKDHCRPIFRRRRKKNIKKTRSKKKKTGPNEAVSKCVEMLKTSGEACVTSDITSSGLLMNKRPSSRDNERGMQILESTHKWDSFKRKDKDSSHQVEDIQDHVSQEINAPAVRDEARHSNLSEAELLAAESILSLSSANICVNTVLLEERKSSQERDNLIIFAAPTADHENHPDPESQEIYRNNSFNCTVISSITDDDHNMTVTDIAAIDTAIGSDIYATAPPVAINETHNLVVVDISENIGGLVWSSQCTCATSVYKHLTPWLSSRRTSLVKNP